MTTRLQEKYGYWYGILNYKDGATGKYVKKWIATGLTVKGNNKRKAGEITQQAALDFEAVQKNKALRLTDPAHAMTLDELISEWLPLKQLDLRANTFAAYEDTANVHVLPYFKELGVTVAELGPVHIQKYYAEKFKAGLSPGTLTRHRTIIRSSLDYAIQTLGIIKFNPADAITLPKTTKRKVLAFTQDEQSALLSELADHRLYALFVFALGTGLRRGELLALKWADVDMEMQEIAVRASMTRSKDRDEHGDIIEGAASQSSKKLGEVKTDSGYRVVPLTDEVKDVLVKHKKAQTEERLHAGPGWANNDLVFSNTLGGFLEPRNTTRLYESKRNAAAVRPLTFHSMRHSFATNAIAAGMDYYYLSRIMGHANISITLDTYADFMPDKSRAEMKKLEGVLLLKKA